MGLGYPSVVSRWPAQAGQEPVQDGLRRWPPLQYVVQWICRQGSLGCCGPGGLCSWRWALVSSGISCIGWIPCPVSRVQSCPAITRRYSTSSLRAITQGLKIYCSATAFHTMMPYVLNCSLSSTQVGWSSSPVLLITITL